MIDHMLFLVKNRRIEMALRLIALICAAWLLVILPLAFHDGFFDINRIKVDLALRAVPVFVIVFFVLLLYGAKVKKGAMARSGLRFVYAALTTFMISCIMSSAMQGFSPQTLYGNTGRYCGLFLLLCCGASFGIISLGALDGRMSAALAVAAACVISILGILNVSGIDPFGFYIRIEPSQISIFLSTIGNIDFFGAYLAMLFPLAGACAVFAQRRRVSLCCGTASFLLACGIAASRSDSALAALSLACLMLAACSGDSIIRLKRALLIMLLACAAIPAIRPILQNGKWEINYTGVQKMLCDTGMIWCICLMIAALFIFCHLAERKGVRPPDSRRLLRTVFVLLGIAAILLLSCSVYFTFIAPSAELGAFSAIFRFDDEWGTRRGFVYRCSIKAFTEFSLLEKVFGGGVDCARQILTPYFDDASMLKYGTFNDAHCQPLQYLLTTGITGAVSFILLYVSLLQALFARMREDAMLTGAFCFLCAYAPIALLGVTQPIIMMTYFSVAALAASRLNHLNKEEGMS